MIYDLYTWPTPNGWKVHILLEELGAEYRVIPVDIGSGDQFAPEYLKKNPNNKMPTLVDGDQAIMESGAILMHLAEKYGKFMGESAAERSATIQWLMWQMGGFGPMLGQVHHFLIYAPEKVDYAINRYTNEAKRLYGVLEKQLEKSGWANGYDYSIADMAIMPWARLYKRQDIDPDTIPNIRAWLDRMYERPAVQAGLKVLADERDRKRTPEEEAKAKELLFGKGQLQNV